MLTLFYISRAVKKKREINFHNTPFDAQKYFGKICPLRKLVAHLKSSFDMMDFKDITSKVNL